MVTPGRGPSAENAAEPEPHHTHLVLVPGTSWGDESPWLTHVADALADGRGSVTVVINGGDITYADAAASIDRGRPVVVLAGTGRTADAIAGARRRPGRRPARCGDCRIVADPNRRVGRPRRGSRRRPLPIVVTPKHGRFLKLKRPAILARFPRLWLRVRRSRTGDFRRRGARDIRVGRRPPRPGRRGSSHLRRVRTGRTRLAQNRDPRQQVIILLVRPSCPDWVGCRPCTPSNRWLGLVLVVLGILLYGREPGGRRAQDPRLLPHGARQGGSVWRAMHFRYLSRTVCYRGDDRVRARRAARSSQWRAGRNRSDRACRAVPRSLPRPAHRGAAASTTPTAARSTGGRTSRPSSCATPCCSAPPWPGRRRPRCADRVRAVPRCRGCGRRRARGGGHRDPDPHRVPGAGEALRPRCAQPQGGGDRLARGGPERGIRPPRSSGSRTSSAANAASGAS